MARVNLDNGGNRIPPIPLELFELVVMDNAKSGILENENVSIAQARSTSKNEGGSQNARVLSVYFEASSKIEKGNM